METYQTHPSILRRNKGKGFTLIEIVVVVAILAVIVSIGIPALRNSKIDAWNASEDACAKILNEGLVRASLDGLSTTAYQSCDTYLVAGFLMSNNYVTRP